MILPKKQPKTKKERILHPYRPGTSRSTRINPSQERLNEITDIKGSLAGVSQ